MSNATVVALNQFDSRISNAGALYTAHVRPEKPTSDWVGPFAIDVQVGDKSLLTLCHQLSLTCRCVCYFVLLLLSQVKLSQRLCGYLYLSQVNVKAVTPLSTLPITTTQVISPSKVRCSRMMGPECRCPRACASTRTGERTRRPTTCGRDALTLLHLSTAP